MFKLARKILLHSGHTTDDGINLRRWFIFYLVYLTMLSGLALLSIKFHGRAPHRFGQYGWLLVLYLFYMSLCCTFFPAPTAWFVLLMASPIIDLNFVYVDNLYLDTLATIVGIALIGALGTALANLNEYHIFTFMLRFGHVYKLRDTGLYQTAARWFDVSPFVLLGFVSFLPIPVDVVRWLAITRRYRRDHYFLASFTGRFLRYLLLAATATCLQLTWKGILAIQLGLIGLILLRFACWLSAQLKKKRHFDNSVSSKKIISAEG